MEPKEFKRLSAAILTLFPPLPEDEQRVALTLYRLLATAGPVSEEALAQASGRARADIGRVLSHWTGVYRDQHGQITGYGGLTVAETSHRLRLGHRVRHTWCAWDTLFIPQLLNVTAQVESDCPVTGESVALTVGPDRVEPAGEPPLISFVAPRQESAAADIVGHFCCHVHFFAKQWAAEDWVAAHPGAFVATLDQAWQLGRRRNAQHYPLAHA